MFAFIPEDISIPFNGRYSAKYRSSWLSMINLNYCNFTRYRDCDFFNDDEECKKICLNYIGPILSVSTDGNDNFEWHNNYIGSYSNNESKIFIFKIKKKYSKEYEKEKYKLILTYTE